MPNTEELTPEQIAIWEQDEDPSFESLRANMEVEEDSTPDNDDTVEPTNIEHTLISITNTIYGQQWGAYSQMKPFFCTFYGRNGCSILSKYEARIQRTSGLKNG